jgi:SRSO17 transposase
MIKIARNFVAKRSWDDQKMLDVYQEEAMSLFSDAGSMLTVDSIEFPRPGKLSAGVANQFCGLAGKTLRCQAGVMLGLCGEDGCELVDGRLFIPPEWFEDDFLDKRSQCGLPADLTFQTKAQLAAPGLRAMVESGRFKGSYLGLGPDFSDWEFLGSLPEGLVFFADVPPDRLLFPFLDENNQPQAGLNQPRRMEDPDNDQIKLKPVASPKRATVKDLIAGDRLSWSQVLLPSGTPKPVVTKEKRLRVAEACGFSAGRELWLYSFALDDGSIRYSLCNEAAESSLGDLRKLALMRLRMERCFKECVEDLGMASYEARNYKGWHRHVLLVFLAHFFVSKLRLELKRKKSEKAP